MDSSPRTPSPKSKKLCQISTPTFKVPGAVASTPKCARGLGLEFASVVKSGLRTKVKVYDVPRPFIELNFMRALEKKLKKVLHKAVKDDEPIISKIYNYDKITNSAIVELSSEEITQSVINLQNVKLVNNTLLFECASDSDPFFHMSAITNTLCNTLYEEETLIDNAVSSNNNERCNSILKDNSFIDAHGGDDIKDLTWNSDKNESKDDSTDSDEDKGNAEDGEDDDVEELLNSGEEQTSKVNSCDNHKEVAKVVTDTYSRNTNQNLPSSSDLWNSNVLSGNKVKVCTSDCSDDLLQEDLLVPFIIAAMEELQLVQEGNGDGIIKSYTKNESFCILELASPELAFKACSLTGMEYIGATLSVEAVGDSYENTLMVLNVPSGKEMLVWKYLEALFVKKGLSCDGQAVISNLFIDNHAVFLKLTDRNAYIAVLKMEVVKFLTTTLIFVEPSSKTMQPASLSEIPMQTASSSGTYKLPSKDKNKLVDVQCQLDLLPSSAGSLLTSKSLQSASSSSQIPKKKTASSSEMQKQTASSSGTHTHKQAAASCSSNIPKITALSSNNTKDPNDVVNVDCLLGEEEGVQLKSTDYLMKEDAGKVLFLKKLILTRRLFHNRQNYTAGHARLMSEVRKAGVDIDLAETIRRRSYWQDHNNAIKRGKLSSLYELPLKVIFDKADIETLKGTEFYESDYEPKSQLVDPMQAAATAAMFSKGAVFSHQASRYLIKVVKCNYDILKSSKNQDIFWREVSKMMAQKEYYFEASACERKFLQAQKLHRDFSAIIRRTGGEGPMMTDQLAEDWYWNNDMHSLMENDTISNPPMTVSIGSSRAFKAMATEEDEPRMGRSRIPTLKRPKSKHDAKIEAYLKMAAAMERRTDVIARKIGSNENNASLLPNPASYDEEAVDDPGYPF